MKTAARNLLGVALLLLGGVPAYAQTATPTRTPYVIGTPAAPRAAGNLFPLTETLLSASTVVATSGATTVEGLTYKTVQVTVGSCSSYTLVISGSVDCSSYATLQSLTEATVAASTTGLSTTFTNAIRCIRAQITAISSCTITAVLHASP